MKGPYRTTSSDSHTWTRRVWYRTDDGQKNRTPLPYDMSRGEQLSVNPALNAYLSAANAAQMSSFSSGYYRNAMTVLHNRAYKAWVDKMRGGIQLGVDLAEGDQTLKLIAEVARAIRRPFTTFQDTLRKLKNGSWSTPLGMAGNSYLKWHFGVEPLIKELHELSEMLDGKLFNKEQITVAKKDVVIVKTNQFGLLADYQFKLVARISGFREIENQNLATMSSLGLTNPAVVAWELVPYSFVVDWFYPIGSYLNSLDDLVGRKVTNGYATWLARGSLRDTLTYPQIYEGTPGYGIPQTRSHVCMKRTIGVPAPVLQKGTFKWSTSATRAMTSLSLLAQALPKR